MVLEQQTANRAQQKVERPGTHPSVANTASHLTHILILNSLKQVKLNTQFISLYECKNCDLDHKSLIYYENCVDL